MEFYHLAGRGVDKRSIVIDDSDRLRFLHNLWAFNDVQDSQNFKLPGRRDEQISRSPLVHIHAFCLMLNHYHLLVSEVVENGISLFMKKLNMGYTKYFNERHERSGALWQGKYRKIQVAREAHFLYIPYYIHLNPLDYVMPEWRQGGVRDVPAALDHLAAYRWSSHLDYLGEKNFPSIIAGGELQAMLNDRTDYERTIAAMISDAGLAAGGEAIEWSL